MRPPPEPAAILKRWEAEEITLVELLRQLQACGWFRREIYAYLERQAGGWPEEQRFGNRPKLINY